MLVSGVWSLSTLLHSHWVSETELTEPGPGQSMASTAQPGQERLAGARGADTAGASHKQVDWCAGHGAGAGTGTSLPGQIEPPSQNKQRLNATFYDICQ